MLVPCVPRCVPREIARSGNRPQPRPHRRFEPAVAAHPLGDLRPAVSLGLQPPRLRAVSVRPRSRRPLDTGASANRLSLFRQRRPTRGGPGEPEPVRPAELVAEHPEAEADLDPRKRHGDLDGDSAPTRRTHQPRAHTRIVAAAVVRLGAPPPALAAPDRLPERVSPRLHARGGTNHRQTPQPHPIIPGRNLPRGRRSVDPLFLSARELGAEDLRLPLEARGRPKMRAQPMVVVVFESLALHAPGERSSSETHAGRSSGGGSGIVGIIRHLHLGDPLPIIREPGEPVRAPECRPVAAVPVGPGGRRIAQPDQYSLGLGPITPRNRSCGVNLRAIAGPRACGRRTSTDPSREERADPTVAPRLLQVELTHQPTCEGRRLSRSIACTAGRSLEPEPIDVDEAALVESQRARSRAVNATRAAADSREQPYSDVDLPPIGLTSGVNARSRRRIAESMKRSLSARADLLTGCSLVFDFTDRQVGESMAWRGLRRAPPRSRLTPPGVSPSHGRRAARGACPARSRAASMSS